MQRLVLDEEVPLSMRVRAMLDLNFDRRFAVLLRIIVTRKHRAISGSRDHPLCEQSH